MLNLRRVGILQNASISLLQYDISNNTVEHVAGKYTNNLIHGNSLSFSLENILNILNIFHKGCKPEENLTIA